MKSLTIIKCFCAMLVTVSLCLAQTPVVETFDYEDGLLAGNGAAENGWGSSWEVFEGPEENMYILEGSLDYPGLNVFGNILEGISPEGTGCRAARFLESTWPDEAGKEYWISFLMAIDNAIGNDDSWQGVSLWLDFEEKAYFGKNWGNPNWGIIGDLGPSNYPSTFSYLDGCAWLVAKIEMSGDDANEMAYLWVNPDPSVEPDTTDIAVSGEILLLDEGFNQVVCHLGMSDGITCWYDEVRVGTCFAHVTPEMTSVPEQDNGIPTQLGLSQNYPNPFNPTTTIRFDLTKSANITLKIYNLAGQEIETLVNKTLSSGTHEVHWNAAGQPSGIYFYRLQAGNYSETKKLILQK